MAKKTTNREYFTIIASVLENVDLAEYLDYENAPSETEVADWVSHQIEMIDNRREADAKKRAEKPADELTETVLGVMTRDTETADEILTKVAAICPTNAEGKELTVGMIRARLTKLYNAGKIDKIDIQVNEKSRKAYCLKAAD